MNGQFLNFANIDFCRKPILKNYEDINFRRWPVIKNFTDINFGGKSKKSREFFPLNYKRHNPTKLSIIWNVFHEQICDYFSKSIGKWKFWNCLKLVNITPVFKKGARTSRNNYSKPVIILPVFSKIFEKGLPNQLLVFLSYQSFSAAFEKRRTRKDATDFSKAFDCSWRDLLITKLHAYSLDVSSINLFQNYLWNRKQKTKVDSFFS